VRANFFKVVVEPGMADIEHNPDVVVREIGQEVRLPDSFSDTCVFFMDTTSPCRYVPAYYL
jgi:hypothetical protein